MEPTTESTNRMYDISFDSVSDLVDTVRKLRKDGRIPSMDRCGKPFDNETQEWIGCKHKDILDSCDHIEREWPEGMRIYNNMRNQLHDAHIPMPKKLHRRRNWSEDDGSEVSVDRVMEGQDAYWSTTHREHRPGPMSVTIISDIGAMSSLDHEDILWRGAAAICLTDLLESAGYRVELWSAYYGTDMYHGYVSEGLTRACLKRGSDPLDLSTLININSGWAFRIIWLRSFWYPPSVRVIEGYGLIRSLSSVIDKFTTDTQVILCAGIWSHSAAVSWIRSELEKLK